MKAILIKPSEPATLVEIKDFNDIRAIIGGLLQAIPFTIDTMAFLDEESKVKRDHVPVLNALATFLCNNVGTPLGPRDWIADNMLIVGVLNCDGTRDGEEHDVPDHVIKTIMEASAHYVTRD